MKHFLLALVALFLFTCDASAALRFGVCTTTCTWDASDTSMWSATSGGGTGVSVPGSGDTVTFDAATCVGGTTCTITVNATVNVTSITMGACTASTTGCVLDFSVNNNNATMQFFTGSGTGTRTLKLGNGTWTISGGASANWNILTTTNLTFAANSSTINFLTSAVARSMSGNLTYNVVTISASSSFAPFTFNGAMTMGTLNIVGKNEIVFTSGSTYPITTLNVSGSSGSEVSLRTNIDSTAALLSVASNAPTLVWTAFRDITGTGGATFVATNAFDLGGNAGITINAPTGGVNCILGGWLLWRDLPNHINDNYPAWIDQAA